MDSWDLIFRLYSETNKISKRAFKIVPYSLNFASLSKLFLAHLTWKYRSVNTAAQDKVQINWK